MEHFCYRQNQLIKFYLLSYSECHSASAVAVILTFGWEKNYATLFLLLCLLQFKKFRLHFMVFVSARLLGRWRQRADKRTLNAAGYLGEGITPPKRLETSSGQIQGWKTPGELEVSKPMGCDTFPSVLGHR